MTSQQHTARHRELHAALDELVADWALHHRGKFLSGATIMDLIEWSHEQTIRPDGEHAPHARLKEKSPSS